MRRGERPQEFRASFPIRVSVLGALVAWVVVGAAAVVSGAGTAAALLSVGLFVAFFSLHVLYYWSMTYVVDEYGVTYRGATAFEHFAWEDIVQVRESLLPLGGDFVTTTGGGFVLSSFVDQRERLRDLIVARAGLFPLA
jgi:hypothetical protein